MAGADRLSQLPDDLLRRILHFAPSKEAASTTALSRRWRTPLWRSSGAVNLETRVQDYDRYHHRRDVVDRRADEAGFFSRRQAFVSASVAALDDAAAADNRITRLTLCIKSDRDDAVAEFLNHSPYNYKYEPHEGNLVDVVLAHPAARRVEELRLVAKEWRSDAYYLGEIIWDRVGVYSISLDSLWFETLRVLDLTNCQGLYQPKSAAVVLPRLSSLRLRHCGQHLGSLQSIIDAAPVLAAVCLDSVVIDVTDNAPSKGVQSWGDNDDDDYDAAPPPPKEATPRRLRCPAATLLVLERCKWEEKDQGSHCQPYGDNDDKLVNLIAAEIDAPRLRCFRYKGLLRPFSLSPQPPDMEQVDLQFFLDSQDYRNNKPRRVQATFWRFVRGFTTTRKMKLILNHLEDAALLSEARRVNLLPPFRRLEQLELQGLHRKKGKTAAVLIANLLRCCPMLRDLRMNLIAEHHAMNYNHADANEFLERKFRYDHNKSTHRLESLRHCGELATVSREGDGYGVNFDEPCEIPCLSRHSFECLQSSLTRVYLKFQLEGSNCLGVKLIKFFAENATVLQEMHINAGNGKLWDHMNHKVEVWLANLSKGRKPPSFVVLPLRDDMI